MSSKKPLEKHRQTSLATTSFSQDSFHYTKKNQRKILLWLGVCVVLVICMILLGGLTRLTESGLSMTQWKPISGIFPPLSPHAWAQEFFNYQQFPEYALKHVNLDLAGFKFIFWMEYAHRLLGRALGLVFLIPLFFLWKNLVRSHQKRTLFMGILLIGQGFMGWYMVKSGLVRDPHVSHYRLAAHLLLAFSLLAMLLWTIFDLTISSADTSKSIQKKSIGKRRVYFLLTCVMLTIFYGALVAGLRAGKLYNTFPRMGEQWIPSEWLYQSPWYLNFLENPVTVQWTHRVLGIVTFGATLVVVFNLMRSGLKTQGILLLLSIILQLSLGIATVIYIVPVSMALLHQMGAVLLFILILKACHDAQHVHV